MSEEVGLGVEKLFYVCHAWQPITVVYYWRTGELGGGGQLAQSKTRGALLPGFQTAMLYKPVSGLTLWLVLALHGSLHHELIGIGKKNGFCALRIAEYGSLAL